MKGKKKILLAVVLVLVMAVGITSIVVIRNRKQNSSKSIPSKYAEQFGLCFDTDTSLTELLLQTTYRKFILIDVDRSKRKSM